VTAKQTLMVKMMESDKACAEAYRRFDETLAPEDEEAYHSAMVACAILHDSWAAAFDARHGRKGKRY
jgi:hypothetical protein